jgi:SAM-dependent methyltransferase
MDGTGEIAMTGTYLLGASRDERERLLYQGLLFRPEAERLLDRCRIPAGGRVIDVGCGPLGVLDLLADRVGPAGEVVGLDSDPRMLDMARQAAADCGLGAVTLVCADAADTGLPAGSFDTAHTRLVLMNVPSAQAVVREMVRLVRPGGTVGVQDVDWVSRVCWPAHPAWDRLVEVIAQLWTRNGMDVHLGRRLPHLLRSAGLTDVGADAAVRIFQRGDPYQTLLVSRADRCRDGLLDAGLITAGELDSCIAALSAHLDHPDTVVLHPTLVQAWGRKPAGPGGRWGS